MEKEIKEMADYISRKELKSCSDCDTVLSVLPSISNYIETGRYHFVYSVLNTCLRILM